MFLGSNGTARIHNSTIANNRAVQAGGGILVVLLDVDHPVEVMSTIAIGAGSNPDALTLDQRGLPRVSGSKPDIGSVEVVQTTA